MNKIAFVFLIVFSFNSIAQSNITIGAKAKRTIEVLNENHLKPRMLNDDLSKSIHLEILSSLDGDKVFFTKENTADFHVQMTNLTIDLSNETEVYISKLKKNLC